MSYHRHPCSGGNGFLGGCDPVIPIPERDHNKLENRDEANQHPIEAITNLRTELNQMSRGSEELSELVEDYAEKTTNNTRAIRRIREELDETVKESELQSISIAEISEILGG